MAHAPDSVAGRSRETAIVRIGRRCSAWLPEQWEIPDSTNAAGLIEMLIRPPVMRTAVLKQRLPATFVRGLANEVVVVAAARSALCDGFRYQPAKVLGIRFCLPAPIGSESGVAEIDEVPFVEIEAAFEALMQGVQG